MYRQTAAVASLLLSSIMVETQGPTVDAVSIAFGVLTLITISLRLWARIFVVKSLGVDDCEYTNFYSGEGLGN